MANKIKRNLVKSFLDTTPSGAATYALIGDGVKTGTINMNPKTTEETYIHEESGSISVDSYAPNMPIEMTAKEGDPVFEYIDNLRITRATLDDAETWMVNVWLYETPALNVYYAERIKVSVQVDTFGGDGGAAIGLNYTINQMGDPIIGGFDPTELEFTPLPVTAFLTTMVIGAVTLTPLFSADHKWLWYAGSVANGTTEVQMDSTLSGATIVQKDDAGDPVLQAGDAALDVGVNHLTIEVEKGGEEVIYHIDITRAAP